MPAGVQEDLMAKSAVNVLRSKTSKNFRQKVLGGIAQLARAVALQAIGQGFESPYLQKIATRFIIGSLTYEDAGRQFTSANDNCCELTCGRFTK